MWWFKIIKSKKRLKTNSIIEDLEILNNNLVKEDNNDILNPLVTDKFEEKNSSKEKIASTENNSTNKREKKKKKDRSKKKLSKKDLLKKQLDDEDPNLEKKKWKLLNKPGYANLESGIEFKLYATLWVTYHVFGLILPFLFGILYFDKILTPLFFGIRDITVIMSNPLNIFVFLTAPLIYILIYFFRLICCVLIAKFYYYLFNRIWKRREMINAPPRGDTVEDVNIYHHRGFILRIIKWQITKSPFPWMSGWVFNFIGSNKIGKNVVIENDHIWCMEFLEMKDNSYLGTMSIVSSHLVEGQYGALTVKKVKIGKNSVIGAHNLVAPGVELGDNCDLLPYSGTTKYKKLKDETSYWGLPTERITQRRSNKMIKLPKDLADKMKKKKKKKNTKI